MKKLILVRHAKAESPEYEISDFERGLKQRGIDDAHHIAAKLYNLGHRPDHIVSSPALRALETAEIYAEELNYPNNKIQYVNFLYDPYTTTEFLRLLHSLDDHHHSVIVVGHNPTIANTAFNLLKNFYGEVPTCTTIIMEFDVPSWKDVKVKTGEMSFYECPVKTSKV